MRRSRPPRPPRRPTTLPSRPCCPGSGRRDRWRGAALDAFERHLRETVLPRAAGEGRLGPERFAAKLAHTMQNPAMTPGRIRGQAEREFGAVRAEMVRLAPSHRPALAGRRPVPDGDAEIVRAVLAAIAVEHPRRDELLDYCRAEVGRIEAFCRDVDLVGLADEPLEIGWTPVFLRAFGWRDAQLAGAARRRARRRSSRSRRSRPMPDPRARPSRALREDNARMLRLLTIHEAMPGHYLQGVYANRQRVDRPGRSSAAGSTPKAGRST